MSALFRFKNLADFRAWEEAHGDQTGFVRRANPHSYRTLSDVEARFLGYYGPDNTPPPPPLLSNAEAKEIFLAYHRRRTAARRELLVRQYLCWAFKLAAKMKGPRLSFDDAVSAANAGLMEAIENFDPTRGKRFIVYSFTIIRRHVIDALVNTYPVKVSTHMRKKLKADETRVEAALAELKDDADPRSIDEVFDRLSQTSDYRLVEIHDRPEDASFVPAPVDAPSTIAERDAMSVELQQAIARLSPLEREAIRAHHLKDPPESFDSIGRRLRVSKNRVREAHDMALVTLRKHLSK